MEKTLKKKTAILCYTKAANELAEKIKQNEEELGLECEITCKPLNTPKWVKDHFDSFDVLLFICAMGIAIRHIAPFIKSKLTDPAVIVMDEKGKNVISVLSGHIGGANEITDILANKLGANPVITTASDVNKKIAVDVFAVKNDLVISDFDMEKKIAAEIVAGNKVGLVCEGNIVGPVPDELVLLDNISDCIGKLKYCIYISDSNDIDRLSGVKILQLIPKSVALGLGCKRGKSFSEIEEAVFKEIDRLGLKREAIASIASIDLKKDEPGLKLFTEHYGIKTSFYSALELDKLTGDFEKSEFVEKITGVDNVCERALIKFITDFDSDFDKDNLLLKKKKCDGITLAVAKIDWSVCFE